MSDTDRRATAVREAIEQRRRVINEAFPEYLPIEEPPQLYEAARHIIDAGGKRLRPTIVMLVAESLTDGEVDTYQAVEPVSSAKSGDGTDDPVDIMAAAISIEVIQSFTLIHDDIMDDDELRRGTSAVHEAYDLELGVLSGDTLYAKAFEYLLETGAPTDRIVRASRMVTQTCTEICEGQAYDINFETRSDVTLDEYLQMVREKTAVLYAASAAVPAVLLGADDETVDELYQFGLDIGQAFQIQDDLLDLTRSSEQLGKQRGSDLIKNKQTIVTIHARQQGVDVGTLIDADERTAITERDIDRAVRTLEDAGSIAYAQNTAHELVEDGQDRLAVLPAGTPRDRLADLAWYLIEREY